MTEKQQEIQMLERQQYRDQCLLRCLESSLDRIDLSEFDGLMEQIESTRGRLYRLGLKIIQLKTASLEE